MKRGDPYYKRYPRDILNATRLMSLELRGAYSDILDLIYMHDGDVPDDDKWLSHALCISVRKWRAIKTELVNRKKIATVDGKIINERAAIELDCRAIQRQANSDSAVSRERTKRQSTLSGAPKSSENSENTNENNEREARSGHHTHASSATAADSARKEEDGDGLSAREETRVAKPTVNTKELSDRLLNACNGALDNPVNCLGLLSVTTPIMWIDQGCDLDRDIIPTLEAAGKKYHGRRIRSWEYFSGMVEQARQRRVAGMPEVPLEVSPRRTFQPDVATERAQQALDRRIARQNEVAHG